MKRIFVQDINQQLDSNNIHYLKKTLRIKEITEILIFDGEKEYLTIFNPYDNTIKTQNITRIKENLFLKLAIAEIKKERLEWLVEKATELGAQSIFILKTDKSQKYPNNLNRLIKIAIEACKQCNRISIPKIEYISLKNLIEKINPNEWIAASLNSTVNKISKKTGVLIGPEGGWSKEEELIFKNQNIQYINLGNLILRSETAAISSLTHLIISNQINSSIKG